MKRTTTRILAMMVLYNYEMTKEQSVDDILEMIEEEVEIDLEFLNQLVQGVLEHQREIDHIASRYLKNYTLDRLNVVDRNLIRIGVYELKYTNTPTSIIINEIIEISKEYSEINEYSSSKFNNSLLDSIAKGLGNGK